MLYGLLCSLGVKGGLIVGLTVAEVMAKYWSNRYKTNSKRESRPSNKVFLFNRRLHHGQIGLLLTLPLLFRGGSVPAAIFTGIGIGLAKDDYADFREWFHFRKKGEDESNDHCKGNYDNKDVIERQSDVYIDDDRCYIDNQDIRNRINLHSKGNGRN